MEDIGFSLILIYLFFGPWLLRRAGASQTLVRIAAIAGLALIGAFFADYAHVYVPKFYGRPFTTIVLVAIAVRLFFEISEPAEKPAAK